MTTLAAAARAHSDAEFALEDARARYQAAGWSHLQAPTGTSARTLRHAAQHFQAATEVVRATGLRVSDAQATADLDAAIEGFASRPIRLAA